MQVLLVEDDAMFADALTLALEELDFSVTLVQDVEAALAVVREGRCLAQRPIGGVGEIVRHEYATKGRGGCHARLVVQLACQVSPSVRA